MSLEDDVKKNKLGYGSASSPLGAFLNAESRSEEAIKKYPSFFGAPKHQKMIDDVKSIIRNTFGTYVDIYENARENRGNPFTAIKFSVARWPSNRQAVKKVFWKPLENLGFTKDNVKLTKTGYIIRIF